MRWQVKSTCFIHAILCDDGSLSGLFVVWSTKYAAIVAPIAPKKLVAICGFQSRLIAAQMAISRVRDEVGGDCNQSPTV